MARARPRWPIQRDRAAGEVVAAGREPGVEGAVRQPLVAGGVRQSRLHQHGGRGPRAHAGAARGAGRPDREAAVGAAVQPLPERRAAASRRVGVARGRSGHREHLRVHRRRAAVLRVAGRQAALGSIARGGLRRRHHPRRPDDVADHRGRSRRAQHAGARVGRSQSPGQPLLRLRQADRAHGVGEPRRRRATTTPTIPRRSSSICRRAARSSSAAPTARITRCASTPARRSGRWK